MPGGAHIADRARPRGGVGWLQLTIAWSAHNPGRVGECLPVSDAPLEIGGGPGGASLVRCRPDGEEPRGPLTDPELGPRELAVEAAGRTVRVTRLGAADVHVDGVALAEGEARLAGSGSIVRVGERLLLAVAAREPMPRGLLAHHPFGEPDEDGLVGEGAACWNLRRRLRTLGPAGGHVLLRGGAGTDRALVARAVHRLTGRSGRLVTASVAELDEAELFGDVSDGRADRPGLVGLAHEGTLFLDVIDALGGRALRRLLKVLDEREVQRRGEAGWRFVDLRVVVSTERRVAELDHDLQRHLVHQIELPSLREHPVDVPLLLRHLVRDLPPSEVGEPILTCRLVEQILRHPLPGNRRQLEELVAERVRSLGGWAR